MTKEDTIEGLIEEYIQKWMIMSDNPATRKTFPDDHWYGKDPLRVCVSHVGIDQLRKLAKAIEQYVIKAKEESEGLHIKKYIMTLPMDIRRSIMKYDAEALTNSDIFTTGGEE